MRLLTPNLEGLHARTSPYHDAPRASLEADHRWSPTSTRCHHRGNWPGALHPDSMPPDGSWLAARDPPTGESRWPLPTPAPRADSSQRRVGCFGVAEACLPLRHGAPGGAKPVSQCHLRQADVGAQRQHHLSEGIVSLSVRVSLHERFPFCVTRRSENYAAM